MALIDSMANNRVIMSYFSVSRSRTIETLKEKLQFGSVPKYLGLAQRREILGERNQQKNTFRRTKIVSAIKTNNSLMSSSYHLEKVFSNTRDLLG